MGPATVQPGSLTQGGPLQIEREKKQHTIPPTSLVGQLLWREFFYAAGDGTPNYDKMEGNPVCKQVPEPTLMPASEATQQELIGGDRSSM